MNPLLCINRRGKNRSDRNGNALVIILLSALLFIALAAFVIDFSQITYEKSQMQNAADAAALAGAKRLTEGDKKVRKIAQNYVDFNITQNRAIALKNEDVEIGFWDASSATFTVATGGPNETPNAVRVICVRNSQRNNALTLSFARILGTEFADITQSAIAQVRSIQCGQIIGIDQVVIESSSYTDSFHSTDGPYDPLTAGTNGHVCSNGPILVDGSAIVKGNATSGPNSSVTLGSSAAVLGNISQLSQPMDFPPVDPGDAATNNDNLAIPLTSSGNSVLDSANNFHMKGGETVTLPPGTYYFNSLLMSGGSEFAISGPTKIYVAGDVDMRGGTTANLTGTAKDFLFYPMGTFCSLSGSTVLQAILYAPDTHVDRGGSSDFYGSIVAKTLTLNGSGGVHADESLDAFPAQSNLGRSFLVE